MKPSSRNLSLCLLDGRLPAEFFAHVQIQAALYSLGETLDPDCAPEVVPFAPVTAAINMAGARFIDPTGIQGDLVGITGCTVARPAVFSMADTAS